MKPVSTITFISIPFKSMTDTINVLPMIDIAQAIIYDRKVVVF